MSWNSIFFIKGDVIIRNYASNLIFVAQLAGRPAAARQAHHGEAGPPRRGKPMTFR